MSHLHRIFLSPSILAVSLGLGACGAAPEATEMDEGAAAIAVAPAAVPELIECTTAEKPDDDDESYSFEAFGDPKQPNSYRVALEEKTIRKELPEIFSFAHRRRLAEYKRNFFQARKYKGASGATWFVSPNDKNWLTIAAAPGATNTVDGSVVAPDDAGSLPTVEIDEKMAVRCKKSARTLTLVYTCGTDYTFAGDRPAHFQMDVYRESPSKNFKVFATRAAGSERLMQWEVPEHHVVDGQLQLSGTLYLDDPDGPWTSQRATLGAMFMDTIGGRLQGTCSRPK